MLKYKKHVFCLLNLKQKSDAVTSCLKVMEWYNTNEVTQAGSCLPLYSQFTSPSFFTPAPCWSSYLPSYVTKPVLVSGSLYLLPLSDVPSTSFSGAAYFPFLGRAFPASPN